MHFGSREENDVDNLMNMMRNSTRLVSSLTMRKKFHLIFRFSLLLAAAYPMLTWRNRLKSDILEGVKCLRKLVEDILQSILIDDLIDDET